MNSCQKEILNLTLTLTFTPTLYTPTYRVKMKTDVLSEAKGFGSDD